MIKISYNGRSLFNVEVHGEIYALYYNYSLFIKNEFAKSIRNVRDIINNHNVIIESDTVDLPEELVPYYDRNSNATNESVEIFGIMPNIGLADATNSAVTPTRVGDTRVIPYSNLTNKPAVNGIELGAGNNSAEKLGLVIHTDYGRGLMQGGEGLTDYNYSESDKKKLDSITQNFIDSVTSLTNRVREAENTIVHHTESITDLDETTVRKQYIIDEEHSTQDKIAYKTNKGRIAEITNGKIFYYNTSSVIDEDDFIRQRNISDNNYTDAEKKLLEQAVNTVNDFHTALAGYANSVNGVPTSGNSHSIIIDAKDVYWDKTADDKSNIKAVVNALDSKVANYIETNDKAVDKLENAGFISAIGFDIETSAPEFEDKIGLGFSINEKGLVKLEARGKSEIDLAQFIISNTIDELSFKESEITTDDGDIHYVLPVSYTKAYRKENGDADTGVVNIKVPRYRGSDTIIIDYPSIKSDQPKVSAVVAETGKLGVVTVNDNSNIKITNGGLLDIKEEYTSRILDSITELSKRLSADIKELQNTKLDKVWPLVGEESDEHPSPKNRVLYIGGDRRITFDPHVTIHDIDTLDGLSSDEPDSVLYGKYSTLNAFLSTVAFSADVVERDEALQASINNLYAEWSADSNALSGRISNLENTYIKIVNGKSATNNIVTLFGTDILVSTEESVTISNKLASLEGVLNTLTGDVNLSGSILRSIYLNAKDALYTSENNGKDTVVTIKGAIDDLYVKHSDVVTELSHINETFDTLYGDKSVERSISNKIEKEAQFAEYTYDISEVVNGSTVTRNIKTTINDQFDELRGEVIDVNKSKFINDNPNSAAFTFVTKAGSTAIFEVPIVSGKYALDNTGHQIVNGNAGILSASEYAYIRDKVDHTIRVINGISVDEDDDNSITIYGTDIQRSDDNSETITDSLINVENRITNIEDTFVKSVNGISAVDNNVTIKASNIKYTETDERTIPEVIADEHNYFSNQISGNTDNLAERLAAEAKIREENDTNIRSALNTEIQNRETADSELQTAINNEKRERQDSDSVLNAALLTKLDKTTFEADKSAQEARFDVNEGRLDSLESKFTDDRANSAINDSKDRNIADSIDNLEDKKLDKETYEAAEAKQNHDFLKSVNGKTVDEDIPNNATIVAADINMSTGDTIDAKVLDNTTRIETVESYFDEGKAKNAIADGDNRNIVDTYATKVDVIKEITDAVLVETERAKAAEKLENERALAAETILQSNIDEEIANRGAAIDGLRTEVSTLYLKKSVFEEDKESQDNRLEVLEHYFTNGHANSAIADTKGREISKELDAKVYTTTFDETIARIDAAKEVEGSISQKVYTDAQNAIYSVDGETSKVTTIKQAIAANTAAIEANNRRQFVKVDSADDIPLEYESLGKIFLAPKGDDPNGEAGIKEEFIVINTGDEENPVYELEEIGDTDIDLTEYAKMEWTLSAEGAKNAFYKTTNHPIASTPIKEIDNATIPEKDFDEPINNTIEEALDALYRGSTKYADAISLLNSLFTNVSEDGTLYAAKNAIADQLDRNIVDTYATKEEHENTINDLAILTERVDNINKVDTDFENRIKVLEDTYVTTEKHDEDIKKLEDTKLENHYDPTIMMSTSADMPRYTNRVMITTANGDVEPSEGITTRELNVLNGIDAFGDDWTLASFVKGVPSAIEATFGDLFQRKTPRDDAMEIGTNDAGVVLYDKYKVLSDNNYSDEEKEKLEGIEAGAEVNVQADWEEADTESDAYILNKPVLANVATSGLSDDVAYGEGTVKDALDDLINNKVSSAEDVIYNDTNVKKALDELISDRKLIAQTNVNLDNRLSEVEREAVINKNNNTALAVVVNSHEQDIVTLKSDRIAMAKTEVDLDKRLDAAENEIAILKNENAALASVLQDALARIAQLEANSQDQVDAVIGN